MRIAIQGGQASFHAIAARQLLGDHELVCCDSFTDVFAALSSARADRAVVACENSLYGTIREVYDLLQAHTFSVIDQTDLHVRQQLIGWPDVTFADIHEIYSHPVALDQCRRYLATNFPHVELIEYHDTAEAVRLVHESQLRSAAAIAGTQAAEAHGMSILEPDIEDEPTNFTRFIVITSEHFTPPANARHALLVLTASHSSGALFRALKVFTDLGVNLTNLESRPIRGEKFRYQFFISADISIDQLHQATQTLESDNCNVRVLGHF